MKFTQILFKQHIGWHYKQLWKQKSKVKVLETNATAVLEKKGIQINDPIEYLHPRKFERFEAPVPLNKPVVYDETHPDWKERVCLKLEDNNVLLEGLQQAKVLTNTVEVKEGLPEEMKVENVGKNVDSLVKNIIYSAQVFDAEQVKLPKVKDPERPYHTFPRVYGISENRRSLLLLSKLLHLIETQTDPNLVNNRRVLRNLMYSYPFIKLDEQIQFDLTANTAITSDKLLKPICKVETSSFELPDLHPIKETITLVPKHFYTFENVYPIDVAAKKSYPHTVFIHNNKLEVKNIFEEEVTENQIFGRSLLKAFTVASSFAKEKFGDQKKRLEQPVTVQCVQTDGRLFHFGIFQLNTLNLQNNEIRNVWYQTKNLPLFESCSYENGRPVLNGYSNEPIKHLFSFYKNE